MIQHALLVSGDKQVLVAVAVVVAHCYSHAKQIRSDSGLLGHVCESSIVVVAIKSVPQGSPRTKEYGGARGHHEQNPPAGIFVVEDGNSWRLRFGEGSVGRHGIVLDPVYS